jgi:hopene-associated glycosyltransferase HpnB
VIFWETAVVLVLLIWLVLWLGYGDFWRIAPLLPEAGTLPDRERWPAVDIIVPARNEADILPETLPTLLNQCYPGRLRIFLIDDQSEDNTGHVALGLAGRNARHGFNLVRTEPRPAGWTGKLWALEQGWRSSAKNASPLVLFTDADIAHEPLSLIRLVGCCLNGDYDLVSLMARLQVGDFWSRLLVPAFVYFFALLYPFRWIGDPARKTAGAAGGCVLLRRTALDHAGGLASIADALIDDCSLGQLIKRRGRQGPGRIWLGFTREVVSRRPCPGLATVWHMVVRTAFVQLRFSWLLLLATVLGMSLVFLVPPVCALVGTLLLAAGLPGVTILWPLLIGVTAFLIMARTFRPMVRWYDQPTWRACLLPLAAFLYTLMTLDSARRFVQGAGGDWKGRTYGDVD